MCIHSHCLFGKILAIYPRAEIKKMFCDTVYRQNITVFM